MRAMTISFSTVLIATIAALGAGSTHAASPESPNGPAGKPFVVHEWGTFTSFSGSDGVQLEFRPLADNDLPPFVYDRWSQEGFANPASKGLISARQRMETPVTYFYTDTVRDVRVRVGFPNGLLTEFYPPVESQQPAVSPLGGSSPLSQGALDWGTITLIPLNQLKTQITDPTLAQAVNNRVLNAIVPRAFVANHYTLARATDSALVRVTRPRNEQRPDAPHGDFYERFLFYRGLGNFTLPLSLTSATHERMELTNSGVDDIRGLFLVHVADGHVSYRKYDRVAAGQKLELQPPESTGAVDELAEAVMATLIAEGLYPKEAQAMVNTWRTSWFGEEGTRLFYLLPSATTDAILPLSVEPKPDETVRVMVGRLEIMTTEMEAKITDMVIRSAGDRPQRSVKSQEAVANGNPPIVAEEILKLGRLAEPALVRVKQVSPDPALKYEATLLLNELRRVWAMQQAVR